MPHFRDLTGQRFNNLLVLERAPDYISPKGRRDTKWFAECLKCEGIFSFRACHIVTNHSKGCVNCRNAWLAIKGKENVVAVAEARAANHLLGVTKRKGYNKYRVQFTGKDGKQRHCGDYPTVLEAALAYDKLAKNEFGTSAILNFPEDYL